MYNVVGLIADNCSTNRLVAQKCGKPLLGCNRHRFNIALVDYIPQFNTVIDKVSTLMCRLRYPVAVAKLIEFNKL